MAVLARPWGNRGALIADPCTDLPGRLQRLRRAFLIGPDSTREPVPVEIEFLREHGRRVIVKLRGVDSISQAESLAGSSLGVPLSERPPAPEGEYYRVDLRGCEVIEQSSNRTLGVVTDWIETGGTPLLEVNDGSGEPLLVPFARSICVQIDPDRRRILVDLPEGLEDLNRP